MSYPYPLTAKDEGSFAYLTVKDRMPVIVTNIIDDLCRRKYEFMDLYGKDSNDDAKSIIGKLSAVKNEMQTNKILPDVEMSSNSCNDDKYWQKFFDDYRISHKECPKWYAAPWLFVECYMYRRLDDIFRESTYFSSYDPFSHLKIKTISDYGMFLISLLRYTESILSVESTNQDVLEGHIRTLTQISLWGNQCDLSLSTTESLKGVESITDAVNAKTSNLLVWDFNYFSKFLHLKQYKQTSLGVVLDNAGVELICDLCFITLLMKNEYFSSVTFYPKIRPYFVSDTTTGDFEYVLQNIGNLCPEGHKLGQLWAEYFKQGTWTMKVEPFWTGPQDYNDMVHCNPQLYEDLSSHSLLLFKGDLNYRKLTGDLNWPNDTPFKTSLRSFLPTNLFVLRTIKGGPVTGFDEENPNVVSAKCNNNWYFSGAYGVAHFVDSGS